MTYRVIVEHRGRAPEVVLSTPHHYRALEVANGVPAIPGCRVYVQQTDSADQLQVSQRGRVVRDQPHLPAVGEHKIIRVPLARATLRTGQ